MQLLSLSSVSGIGVANTLRLSLFACIRFKGLAVHFDSIPSVLIVLSSDLQIRFQELYDIYHFQMVILMQVLINAFDRNLPCLFGR